MRKLKLQMQVSVNGYVAGPNGEMDWLQWNWGDDIKSCVTELTKPVDCILMGRKLAEGFIPHWERMLEKPETADDFAKKMVDTPKVVFTKTLESSIWKDTVLAKGNVADEITNLKNQQGGDIITYGGAGFASTLIAQNLVDELHLFINPTVLSEGMGIFSTKNNFNLLHSQTFDCGIILLKYGPKL